MAGRLALNGLIPTDGSIDCSGQTYTVLSLDVSSWNAAQIGMLKANLERCCRNLAKRRMNVPCAVVSHHPKENPLCKLWRLMSMSKCFWPLSKCCLPVSFPQSEGQPEAPLPCCYQPVPSPDANSPSFAVGPDLSLPCPCRVDRLFGLH